MLTAREVQAQGHVYVLEGCFVMMTEEHCQGWPRDVLVLASCLLRAPNPAKTPQRKHYIHHPHLNDQYILMLHVFS